MVANNRRAQRVEHKQYREWAGKEAQHNQERGRNLHHNGNNGRQRGHGGAKRGHILYGAAKARQLWITENNKQNNDGNTGNQKQERTGGAESK